MVHEETHSTMEQDVPTNKEHHQHRSKHHHSKKSGHHHHRGSNSRSHHQSKHHQKKDVIQEPVDQGPSFSPDPKVTRSHHHRRNHHRSDDGIQQPSFVGHNHSSEVAPEPQVTRSSHHRRTYHQNKDEIQNLDSCKDPELTSRYPEKLSNDSQISRGGGPELTSVRERGSLVTPKRSNKKKLHILHESDDGIVAPPVPQHSIDQLEETQPRSNLSNGPEFLPEGERRYSGHSKNKASLKKKDPKTSSIVAFDDTEAGSESDTEDPQDSSAPFHPRPPQTTRYPGAYREGFGSDEYDVESTAFPTEPAENGTVQDADVSGLPVATPIPAELAKDGCLREWWSRPRNRFMLFTGVFLVIAGFAGLIAGLLLRPSDPSTNEMAVAVPECVGRTALAWGEPHVTTFDNLQYDCQAAGEFILLHSLDVPFQVQGRFEALDYDNRVSKITAVAISEGQETPVIQVSLPKSASDGTEKVDVCLVDFLVHDVRHRILDGFTDDTVEVAVVGNNVNIHYSASGAVVTASVMSSSAFDCFLNVFVCLPDSNPSLFNTVGLLGTPNDDDADDWMDPNGDSLQVPSSLDDLLYEPAYEYCTMNWCIRNEADSLFAYYGEDSFNDYENCDLPYPGSVNSDEASDELVARCGDNAACLTEGVIGGEEGTENAINVQTELEETRERTKPTTSSPPPESTSTPTPDSHDTDPDFDNCKVEEGKSQSGPIDGQTTAQGIMFDIKALADLTVNSITIPFTGWSTYNTYNGDVTIWTKQGSHEGAANDITAWIQIFSQAVSDKGGGNFLLNATGFQHVNIAKDSIQAFYIWIDDTSDANMLFRMRSDDALRTTHTPVTRDRLLEMYSGVGTAAKFVPTDDTSEHGATFSGILHYSLCATPLQYPASCSSVGDKMISGPIDGQTTAQGIMFDVKALADLTVTTLTVPFSGWSSYNRYYGVVTIWTKQGTHEGAANDTNAWNLIFSQAVSDQGGGNKMMDANEFENVDVAKDSTQAFYILIRMSGSEMTLRTLSDSVDKAMGIPVTFDRSVELFTGIGTGAPFESQVANEYGSVFSGILHYSLCESPTDYPAQCISTSTSLAAPFEGQTTAHGIMFDVKALADVTVTTLTVPFSVWSSYNTYNGVVTIWTKQGTHEGAANNTTAWNLIFSQAVSYKGGGNRMLDATEFKNVDIASGSIHAFYVAIRLTEQEGMTIRTSTNGTSVGSIAFSDSSLEVHSGVSTGGMFTPYATSADFNGEIHYSLC